MDWLKLPNPLREAALCASDLPRLFAATDAAHDMAASGLSAHDAVDTIRHRFGLTQAQATNVADLVHQRVAGRI